MTDQLIDTNETCSLCREHNVEEGPCAGCGDNISTHCDAGNSAVYCQDCGSYFGNCCCFTEDPRLNRCNACYTKYTEWAKP